MIKLLINYNKTMNKPIIITLLCILLSILACISLYAQNEYLIFNTWHELEPMVKEDVEYPVSIETATKKILEEARIIFSAMVYGYSFTYTPSDNARNIEEYFELIPLYEISWGDPGLKVLNTEVIGNKLHCKIRYILNKDQIYRRNSWNSNSIPYSTGNGSENVFLGTDAKLTSINNSIKDAIKNYARNRIKNKPREISGDILIWDAPYFIINSGKYNSTVRIKLFIQDFIPYNIF